MCPTPLHDREKITQRIVGVVRFQCRDPACTARSPTWLPDACQPSQPVCCVLPIVPILVCGIDPLASTTGNAAITIRLTLGRHVVIAPPTDTTVRLLLLDLSPQGVIVEGRGSIRGRSIRAMWVRLRVHLPFTVIGSLDCVRAIRIG